MGEIKDVGDAIFGAANASASSPPRHGALDLALVKFLGLARRAGFSAVTRHRLSTRHFSFYAALTCRSGSAIARHMVAAIDKLRRWLERHGYTQASFAKLIGVGQWSVGRWLKGTMRPDAHMREAVELITGIERDDWLTDREREQLRALTPRTGTEG